MHPQYNNSAINHEGELPCGVTLLCLWSKWLELHLQLVVYRCIVMKIWVYSYFSCWRFSSCGMWCHIMGVEFEIFWRIIVPVSSGLMLSTFQMIKALDISKCQELHTQQHGVSSQTLETLLVQSWELKILHLCNCLSVIHWYSLASSCKIHVFCSVLTLNNDYVSVWCHQLMSVSRTYLLLETQ